MKKTNNFINNSKGLFTMLLLSMAFLVQMLKLISAFEQTELFLKKTNRFIQMDSTLNVETLIHTVHKLKVLAMLVYLT